MTTSYDIIPHEGEGFRIVEKAEAIYVYGPVPLSWFDAINERAKGFGFDILDTGAASALGCLMVITNSAGSEKVRASIEDFNERKHGADKLGRWCAGTDTGTSSLTIAHVLGGIAMPRRPDIPYDPDDFGRCLRLVRLMGWRDRLGEVADAYPRTAWPGIIEAWNDLVDLYEEERPTGRAPKCYARMQDIIKGAVR